MEEQIAALAQRHEGYVKDLRHWFHRHAEVSWKEYETSAKIVEELKKIGVPYEAHYGNDTNVAAWIYGTEMGEKKTIMLRADMDALPICEDPSHELRSENEGVMHACGHDGHTASLLGTVKILHELRNQFSGTIKIAFEAAEENGGGANDFIRMGFLDDVEALFGCHLFGTVKEGRAAVKAGEFMSGSDAIHITIRGRSGHSSTPNLAIDPVSIAAQFITDAQAVVARLVAPTDIAVVGFSTIHGGTVFNTIPEEVKITGSLRWFNENTRMVVHRGLEGLLNGLCKAYGADYTIRYTNTMYAVLNDTRLTNFVADSLAKVLGGENVERWTKPQMGSESFAYYGEKVPYCFYFIGIDAGDKLPVGHNLHHNSSFCWNDENLKPSMQCMAQVAMDYMLQQ